MRLTNAHLFFDGKPVGELKSFSFRESSAVPTPEALQRAMELATPIWWRGYQGYLVELEIRNGRDNKPVVTKLEGTFRSPVTGGHVTVPIPPNEVRLAP